MNIEVVLLAAGRDAEPPADCQRLRMAIRPGDVAEVGIRRRRGRRLDLDRCREVLRLAGRQIVLRLRVPLLLPRRHRTRMIQPLPVDLTGVLLFQLLHRLEQTQTRYGGLHLLVAPGR